jgi:hypothetical protein
MISTDAQRLPSFCAISQSLTLTFEDDALHRSYITELSDTGDVDLAEVRQGFTGALKGSGAEQRLLRHAVRSLI